MGFTKADAVTDQPGKLDKTTPITVSPSTKPQIRRSAEESITAGLQWIAMAAAKGGRWTDFTMLDRGSDVWVTAHVLARLGELPLDCVPPSLQQHIEAALNWLEKQRTSGAGWSSASREPDAFTTSWAVLALRGHGRGVPRSAIDFLLSCRHSNGGFSVYANSADSRGTHLPSTAEITVTALRSLSMCDSAAEEFLASRLRTELPGMASGLLPRLYACAEILDWENGLAPWALLNRAGQCTAQFDLEKPYEQALLLRSLLRLRNQRAWPISATLRNMQLADGSWPAGTVVGPITQFSTAANSLSFGDTRVISTANVVAALVMNEAQPGLYYGSDVPLPRKLRES